MKLSYNGKHDSITLYRAMARETAGVSTLRGREDWNSYESTSFAERLKFSCGWPSFGRQVRVVPLAVERIVFKASLNIYGRNEMHR
jgi:hypothetical protein